ncbi:uncharacterized protein N7458_008399 [Penicillium daleae]|uniref:Suppressor of anucleate metulae protein B n=1 Tax=Penicillium daleae TaxID=63821 RepID=A0AAD6C2H6_9EURO|nr:uncharacterized protein N7458_008399 [Penicillium daleae]KAJ5444527.1 hypothetical protein N7458_008399 [Penicillium daleae]
MPVDPCSASDCTKPGTLTCDCQRKDWLSHKHTCAGAQKQNCFFIRATAPNGSTNSADRIERLPLRAYGNWGAEMKELEQRLGWPRADEAGKFYLHQEKEDHWYYYTYCSSAKNLPFVEMSRLSDQVWRGTLPVKRSFSRWDLVKTVKYYETANSNQVFDQREKKRFGSRQGFPPGFLDGVPNITI